MKKSVLAMSLSLLLAPLVAAKEQVVTLNTSLQNLYPGETFTVDVNYSVTNQTPVSGLGIQIFFDSTQVTLEDIQDVFGEGKIAQAVQPDLDNLDNDPTTDTYVNISWMSFSGQWPMQVAESQKLSSLTFSTKDDFSGAFIHVGKSSNAAGYRFVGQSLYISAN